MQKGGHLRTASVGRKIDFSTSMNSGSKDAGQMEEAARELSSAYCVREPGRRVSVPPSTRHLAPDYRSSISPALRSRSKGATLRVEAGTNAGIIWRQETPGLETRAEEG